MFSAFKHTFWFLTELWFYATTRCRSSMRAARMRAATRVALRISSARPRWRARCWWKVSDSPWVLWFLGLIYCSWLSVKCVKSCTSAVFKKQNTSSHQSPTQKQGNVTAVRVPAPSVWGSLTPKRKEIRFLLPGQNHQVTVLQNETRLILYYSNNNNNNICSC